MNADADTEKKKVDHLHLYVQSFDCKQQLPTDSFFAGGGGGKLGAATAQWLHPSSSSTHWPCYLPPLSEHDYFAAAKTGRFIIQQTESNRWHLKSFPHRCTNGKTAKLTAKLWPKKNKNKKTANYRKKKETTFISAKISGKKKSFAQMFRKQFYPLSRTKKGFEKKKKSEGNDAKHEEEKKEKNVLQEW